MLILCVLTLLPFVAAAATANVHTNISAEANTGGNTGTQQTANVRARVQVETKAGGQTVTSIDKQESGGATAGVTVDTSYSTSTTKAKTAATTSTATATADTAGTSTASTSQPGQMNQPAAVQSSISQLLDFMQQYVQRWL